MFALRISLLREILALNPRKYVETDNPIFIKMDHASNWLGLKAFVKEIILNMMINSLNVLAKLVTRKY